MARLRKRSLLSTMASIIRNSQSTRIGHLACNLCDHQFIGYPIYVIVLGLIGTVITAFDIIRIMNNNTSQKKSSQSKTKETVPLEVERDLKLMISILGIEHYTLIMLGGITEYPMLHMPWLLMQLCVIIVEVIGFCVRVFLDGFHVKCDELLLSCLAVHNWLQVFCLFHKQVEALYLALIRFTTHCLSSIAFEAGGRAPLGNTTTKSAAFNALFRRSFNLKIAIFVTDIITGLITTAMMSVGDKYGIPYLYLPWLLNTMQGMVLCEGPAILNLVTALVPNVTLPAGTFMFMTLILFVEELCIWQNAFVSFQRCWKDYHRQKQHATTKINEKLLATRMKNLLYEENAEHRLNIALEKLRARQRLEEPHGKSNSRISVKSTVDCSLVRNELPDVTG